MAGPAFVQANSGSSSTSSVSVTLTGVTAGNMLVAYAAVDGATAPSSGNVTGGGTWTQVDTQTNSDTGNGVGSAGMWVCPSATGGSTTVTFSGSHIAVALAIAEYTPAGSTTLDTNNQNSSTSGTTTINPGNVTTTNANDVIVVGGNNGNVTTTYTNGTGYTLRTSITSATNMSIGLQDQTFSATTTGQSTAFGNTSTEWTAIAVAIKSAGAAFTWQQLTQHPDVVAEKFSQAVSY